MDKIGISSCLYNNVYLRGYSSVVGPKEYKGPLGKMYDKHYETLFNQEKDSYEKAEMELVKDAINIVKRKTELDDIDISALIGGDLNNQIAISSYVARDYDIPYLGVFGACSTCTLGFIVGANLIEKKGGNVVTFTSSHNGTAERQFRYPTEYGAQRADSATVTVTGSGAFVLTNEKTNIKLTKATIGKVVDAGIKDFQDMGRVMAPSAYRTIKEHLSNFNEKITDYDLILTGDLSYYGTNMLKEMFKEDGIDISLIHKDAGLMIYDRENQNVMAGGSGCGCITIALSADIFPRLQIKRYRKILVCSTGALMNPIMLAQKESIPSITHAVSFEVVE